MANENRRYLIPFDKDGKELSPKGEKCDKDDCVSEQVLEDLSQDKSITDVFLMSHGWLNKTRAARNSYTKWLDAMEKQKLIEKLPSDFRPLVIGVYWPSDPCADEDLKELGEESLSFDITSEPSIEQLVDLYAERIADTETARQALKTIFEAMMAMDEDNIPDHLPSKICQAYNDLVHEAGLDFDGVAGAPGADQEPLDPDRVFQAAVKEAKKAKEAETDSLSFDVSEGKGKWGCSFSLSALLLQGISFWKMKARACQIGEKAIFPLLKNLQNKADKKVRFHLMGHSFGCIVISAAIAGPKKGDNTLVRPVNSVTLIQGAFSLWSYCSKIPKEHDSKGRSGYFHSIIENGKVSGPIITTQSESDNALEWAYRAATWGRDLIGKDVQVRYDTPTYGAVTHGAVGTYGIQGVNNAEFIVVNQVKDIPPFESGKVYNLNCDEIIGSHTEFAKPEVAHAVWSAVLSGIKESQHPKEEKSQGVKTVPSFNIGPEGDGDSVVDNAEISANQGKLIQSLELFVKSTNQQVEQLKAKVASAQKLLNELKRQS